MGRPTPDDDPTRRTGPDAGGDERGQIACTVTPDGLVIGWTDRECRIEGVVTAPGSTHQELAEPADWWRDNSDFRR